MAQGDGISKKSERKIRTMKRILVISWYFPPINSSEGLVTYKLLKNSKYQYDVCMQDSNDSWSYGKNEQLPECGNVKKICLQGESLDTWKSAAVEYFRKHQNEYDIVMTRSMPPESHEIGLEIKKMKPGITWIASFGDPIANNPFVLKGMQTMSPYSLQMRYVRKMGIREMISPVREMKNLLWKRRQKAPLQALEKERTLEHNILSNCDKIIFNNPYQKKYMLSSCGKEIAKKAVVLPHSFDAELYDASIAPRSSDKIQMVYIGHLDATRTPRLFLKGISALKKEHPDLAEHLEVLFYGHMAANDKVYLIDHELLDVVKIKKPVDYKTSLSIMRNSDWLLHVDANLHGILDENIFFAAKLADYIGANRPIFGMTMFEGAGADVVRAVNGVTVSYSVDEIKNYLYLIAYENYTVEIDQDGMNQFNATEVAEKFDAMVEKLDR